MSNKNNKKAKSVGGASFAQAENALQLFSKQMDMSESTVSIVE